MSEVSAVATTSERGKDYRGDVSTTVTGKTCEAWENSAAAHQNFHTNEFSPEAGLDSNFCRNPMHFNPALSLRPTDVRWVNFRLIGSQRSRIGPR